MRNVGLCPLCHELHGLDETARVVDNAYKRENAMNLPRMPDWMRQRRNMAGCFVILMLVVLAAFFLLRHGEDKTAWKPGMPLAKERVKIGVIHIADVTKATSGYSYAHEVGIRAMQHVLGLNDDQIVRKQNVQDTDLAAIEHSMRQCIVQGANIILATSWGYMGTCEKLAGEYPGVIFAHASGNKRNLTNFTNYFGRMYQARYLSGIIAGLRTATDHIGYVAAMGKDNSEVTGGINAFSLGVESVNPKARVHVKVTHRWFDPRGEIEAANALIAKGCDVITQHCDTLGPQLAAQKAGAWSIGYNSAVKDIAPQAVITSAVWNWDVYYTRLVQSVINGAFTTEPYFGGLRERMVDLTPFNERLLPAGAAEAVSAARRSIENGEFGVFEGAMEANNGRIIGAAGQRLSDAEIVNGMNWYYRNVIEVQ